MIYICKHGNESWAHCVDCKEYIALRTERDVLAARVKEEQEIALTAQSSLERSEVARYALQVRVEQLEGGACVFEGPHSSACIQPRCFACAMKRVKALETHLDSHMRATDKAQAALKAEQEAHRVTSENQRRQWTEKDLYRTRAFEAEAREQDMRTAYEEEVARSVRAEARSSRLAASLDAMVEWALAGQIPDKHFKLRDADVAEARAALADTAAEASAKPQCCVDSEANRGKR